jgi:hypothetical protein
MERQLPLGKRGKECGEAAITVPSSWVYRRKDLQSLAQYAVGGAAPGHGERLYADRRRFQRGDPVRSEGLGWSLLGLKLGVEVGQALAVLFGHSPVQSLGASVVVLAAASLYSSRPYS